MVSAEDILKRKSGKIVSVGPNATVREALDKMTANNIGSILVKDGDALIGIWTERDLLRNTLVDGFSPERARIAEFMVTKLVYTPHTDSVYQLMDRILGLRHRRLLIQKDGVFIGLLTAGDVMKAFMQEKRRELESLNAMVSWEYYEEWRWTRESGKREHPGKA